jgi:hypothetical protein
MIEFESFRDLHLLLKVKKTQGNTGLIVASGKWQSACTNLCCKTQKLLCEILLSLV